ncbi:MAG: guanylate kinase [Planctomycetes bacterium]|nr:guanylate kinase [Planctomycetota bacterium]
MTSLAPGKLIIISGPSGAGKTTLVSQLFERCDLPLAAAVSATTRKPRPGEVDGRDYYFIDEQTFQQRRLAGDFLECCEVFGSGHWYGTLRSEVTPSLAAGKWVVLEIDVQGTLAVLEHYPDAITIFVRPRSLEELERRLRDRGTESEAAIQRRLEVARREWMFAERYRHQVINDDVERSVQQLCDILTNGG